MLRRLPAVWNWSLSIKLWPDMEGRAPGKFTRAPSYPGRVIPPLECTSTLMRVLRIELFSRGIMGLGAENVLYLHASRRSVRTGIGIGATHIRQAPFRSALTEDGSVRAS